MRNVELPSFALPYFDGQVRCKECDQKYARADLMAAGAMRARDGTICFGYEVRCPRCRKTTTILDTMRRFSQADWWNELAMWHELPPKVIDGPLLVAAARQNLPKLGPTLVGPPPYERFWIRGAYKGEVGPVMLIFEGVDDDSPFGVLRLEKGNHLVIFNHGDPNCLAWDDCHRLASTPDGGAFPLAGKSWIKMSASEIEQIVRDRVFSVTVADVAEPDKRRKAQSKSTRQRRGSYECAHAPKVGKGSRRASRNAGEVDSRRRRP